VGETDISVSVEHVSLDLLLAESPRIAAISALGALTFAGLYLYLEWAAANRTAVSVWLATLLATLGWMFIIGKRYARSPRTEKDSFKYSALTYPHAIAIGLCWGCSVFVMLPASSRENESLIFVGITLVLIGCAMTSGIHRKTSLSLILPFLGVHIVGLMRLSTQDCC
jgi:CDP-diglyceride synthetase